MGVCPRCGREHDGVEVGYLEMFGGLRLVFNHGTVEASSSSYVRLDVCEYDLSHHVPTQE